MTASECEHRLDTGSCVNPGWYENSGNLNPENGVYIQCCWTPAQCHLMNPPVPTPVEERQAALLLGQAKRIAQHRGLVTWDRLPIKQTKECGWACQEACLRLAAGDLEAMAEAGAVLKITGENRWQGKAAKVAPLQPDRAEDIS